LKAYPGLTLRYRKLEKSSLRLLPYSDASLHNNEDLTSQLGYAILLEDPSEARCVISFRSFKYKRIARYSMAAKPMAFADTFDAAFSIKNDLYSILEKNISLIILTDSNSLFDVMIYNKYTTKKRWMIDLSAAREGFARRDETNVCRIRSEDNIADPMTKLASKYSLHQIISKQTVDHKIMQYVVDPATKSAIKTVKADLFTHKI
jgi:hypothetical protein